MAESGRCRLGSAWANRRSENRQISITDEEIPFTVEETKEAKSVACRELELELLVLIVVWSVWN